MIGYNGIKILVNKTLSKVIEQVDGGDLILNKGDKEKPKSKHSSNKEGRLLSNKGNKGLGDDEERLDLVLKVLERYQITLEKVGLQEFIEKHLTSPLPTTGSWMSFGSKILLILLRFLQMIIIPRDMRCAAEQGNVYLQVLMVCCGLQIVNWSWMLVRCNPNIEIWDGPRSGTGKVEGSGGFCAKDVVLARCILIGLSSKSCWVKLGGADEVFRLPIRVWIWPMDERLEQDKDSTKIKGQKSRGNRIKRLEDYKKKKKKQDRGAGQRSRE
ncbi:hypothetical protein PPACK8108_LOCUS4630 [Phakopsora pachyrhizi]|uniref:Uncharacterized protein n=1 Tax=Phakopsora pachyrhizi TaxID=170000 RepID=A0AAV0AR96_PHAPC|nr:hypothetical protein PPACK8108_LOCUS4630 [Phakopsora pachyrhizi]